MAYQNKRPAPLFIPPLQRRLTPSLPQSPFPDVYSLSFYKDVVNVTVTKTALHVHQWISYIRQLYSCSVRVLVGLDTEWLPNVAPRDDNPIAIIQLCVGTHCLIFQILHSDCIPASLHAFLADPRHVFCGVGIQEDVDKLYEHHGLRVRCCADLNDLNRMVMTGLDQKPYRHMGLKKMALDVLRKDMKKPIEVTLSKWDSPNLDLNQIEYAAVDSIVSFQIAFTLNARILRRSRHIRAPTFVLFLFA